jgi:hypothetical protein
MIKVRGVTARFGAACSGDFVVQESYIDYQGTIVQEKRGI